MIRVGTSLGLIAIGAILDYAVTYHSNDIDIQTVGLVLLVIGIVGLVLSVGYIALEASRDRRDPYGDHPPQTPPDQQRTAVRDRDRY
jgi:hypothetical protein